MAEACDDLSDLMAGEELSREVECLKAILASDAGLSGEEDHTDTGKNCNSIGSNVATSLEEQASSAVPLDQLLRCNEEVQQSLRKKLKEIDEALRQNRELQTRLVSLATSSKAKLIANSFTLKVFTRSHSYFFQRAQDQPALLGEDDGSGSLFTSRDLAWTPKQEKKLIKGLRRQATDLKIHQLQSKVTGSSQSMKKLKDEIKNISSLPDEELLQDTSEVNWQVIALEEFNNRCLHMDLKLRWENHLHFSINHSEWSKEEDKKLLRLAKEQDYRDWATIAKNLKTNRTAFQCLQRYQQFLNADMINSYNRWSEQEDNALRDAVGKFGYNWAAVSANLGTNRSSQQCLHRWRYSLAPGSKKGRWSEEENDSLRRAVQICGVGNWSRIATMVQTRNAVQCRERWVNVLDASICRGGFTKEEDTKLLEICRQYGDLIPWAEVATKLGNRTDNMCARRWRQLSSTAEVMNQYSKRVKQGALRPHICTKTTKHKRTAIGPEEMEDDLVPSSVKKLLEDKQQTLEKTRLKRRSRQPSMVSSTSSVGTPEESSPMNSTPYPPHQQGVQSSPLNAEESRLPLICSPDGVGHSRSSSLTLSSQQSVSQEVSLSVQEMVLDQIQSACEAIQPAPPCEGVWAQTVPSGGDHLPESPFPPQRGCCSPLSSFQDKMPSELYDSHECSSSLGVVVRALLEMHGSEPSSSDLVSDVGSCQYSHQLPLNITLPPGCQYLSDLQGLPVQESSGNSATPLLGRTPELGRDSCGPSGSNGQATRNPVVTNGPRPPQQLTQQAPSTEAQVQTGEGRLNPELDTRVKRLNAILPGLGRATKLVAEDCEIPAPPVVVCVNPLYASEGFGFLQGSQGVIAPPSLGSNAVPQSAFCHGGSNVTSVPVSLC